jgi:hypothetical protein
MFPPIKHLIIYLLLKVEKIKSNRNGPHLTVGACSYKYMPAQHAVFKYALIVRGEVLLVKFGRYR